MDEYILKNAYCFGFVKVWQPVGYERSYSNIFEMDGVPFKVIVDKYVMDGEEKYQATTRFKTKEGLKYVSLMGIDDMSWEELKDMCMGAYKFN